jgi:hypothetical protein
VLGRLVGIAQRVAFVGLAKNTGKTEALTTLVSELSALGRTLAITSIGRDGEEFDAIQPHIAKPPILCPAGTLVASAAPLLRRSGAQYELLRRTGVRTPLGRVVIARLSEPAKVEVAGPSSSAEIRAVVDEMLALGADQAIVDGSIDRRAAAAPDVADAVIMSTGAVLDQDIEGVVRRTGEAVEMISLPRTADPRLRDLARRAKGNAIVAVGEAVHHLPDRFALTARAGRLPEGLRPGGGHEQTLIVGGVLPEHLLEALLPGRTRNHIRIVASSPTSVFIHTHSPRWYRQRGLHLEVLDPMELTALTVNPQAPLSHSFDSKRLRKTIAEALPVELPILDVREPDYTEAWQRSLAGSPA